MSDRVAMYENTRRLPFGAPTVRGVWGCRL